MSKDISALVVETCVDPVFDPSDYQFDTRHDISDIVYYLNAYEIKVDLVWTLEKHKFDDFEVFRKKAIEAVNSHDWSEDKKNKLIEAYDYLRKKPINDIDDLAGYDFFILHPNCDDCSKILPQIREKYKDVPKIVPKESVAERHTLDSYKVVSGGVLEEKEDYPMTDVTKSADGESYAVEFSGRLVIDLIERLLGYELKPVSRK